MDKFKDWSSKTFTSVKDKWLGIAAKTRILILAIVGVVLVSAIVITAVLNRPEQTVLCTAANSSEAESIAAALANVNINARITPKNEIIVPDTSMGLARVALSERGLIGRGQNNDVWNSGVSMFATESQLRETQKHQLQAWIMDYLRYIPGVADSRVILHIPETKGYVMVTDKEESLAAVQVTLETGKTLTKAQINGIHSFVLNSVPGLLPQNITVTDGHANPLFAVDGADAGEELAFELQRLNYQADFKMYLAQRSKESVIPLLEGVLGVNNFQFAVNAELDYKYDSHTEQVEYTPVDIENVSGIVRKITDMYSAGGVALENGLIGTPNNSDIDPLDYPTIPQIKENGDFYVDWQREKNFEINEKRTFYEEKGYTLKSVTATLVINSENVPQATQDMWKELIAKSIGTTVENVAFAAWKFPLPDPIRETPGNNFPETFNDKVLLVFIIALSVLVLTLIVLAIINSGTKKRHIRYRGTVPMSDGTGYLRDDSYQPFPSDPEGFDLPSLLDENETKDVVLKREIKEFSMSNPEIIAQLIRTWFREDEN